MLRAILENGMQVGSYFITIGVLLQMLELAILFVLLLFSMDRLSEKKNLRMEGLYVCSRIAFVIEFWILVSRGETLLMSLLLRVIS